MNRRLIENIRGVSSNSRWATEFWTTKPIEATLGAALKFVIQAGKKREERRQGIGASLHRHRLRQIPRQVDFATAFHGAVVGEELEGDDGGMGCGKSKVAGL